MGDDYVPYVKSSETSKASADTMGGVKSIRARIFEYFALEGELGATDDEVQRLLDIDPSTQRPRRIELARDRLIEDSGFRRQTRAGRAAVVWRITARGLRIFNQGDPI